jgi:hypothetical protein
MHDLERGWAMVAGEGHGAALLIVLLVVGLVVVTVGMWLAMRGARRRDRQADMSPLQRTVSPRAPLPGPDRGFR